MLNKVKLYGELAERYGKEWNLDINSPAEAIRALSANNKGFREFIGESESRGVGYQVVVGTSYIEDPSNELGIPVGVQDIKIIPKVLGAKSSLGKILVGAIIVYFAWPYLGAAGWQGVAANMAASLGASLVIGGVAEMLAPTPPGPPKDAELSDNKSLGPINTAIQGFPVPVCYGQLLIGGAVISAAVTPNEE
jgi:predicted phage tail protein